MKKLTGNEIRQMFLDFFAEKGHSVQPSAPLVPQNDPTLLWINSGVATLKDYFDGTRAPKNPKIVNSQKSIRTNDIENVGFTARHHTFFEMLGNFSIGDYFKKEAIIYAWEFLTSEKWLNLNEEYLFVTVHPEDDEAYELWKNEIKLDESKIIRLEENFWDIGEGPSGPNTEIFYDRGEAYGNDPNDPELYPGGENERYLEIWNLVFSQFNHNADHTYTPLPKKNIDTGMGLERIASVLQNTPTNFETDLFMPIIKRIEQDANVSYGENEKADRAFKVVADHIRTVCYAIGDQALPSNEGRGYVLRRLIRRAVRFLKDLGIEKPFMYKIVDTVGKISEEFYPEVCNQKEKIAEIIQKEEERFHETLNDGLALLTKIINEEKEKNNKVFPGEEAFKLYDTYGFPKELTEEYVKDEGFTFDEAGFEKEMEKQRERARKARENVESMQVQDEIFTQLDLDSTFVGYNQKEVSTQVIEVIKNNAFAKRVDVEESAYILLKETPFYAESGGQLADKGLIYNDHFKAIVKDVQKAPRGEHLHEIKVIEGNLTKNVQVKAIVDKYYRTKIIKNHTATHLLHQALKDVLGDHVNQAGSLVACERLRFDFTHYHSVSENEIKQIEQIVNEKIWEEIPLVIQYKQIDEAKAMGAIALFGEKYDDEVRVVKIDDYSIELCGGCHVQNTKEIGLFKIVQETGVGAGVRRIEAVTSKEAFQYIESQMEVLTKASNLLKVQKDEVTTRIETLLKDIKDLERTNDSLSKKLSNFEAAQIEENIEKIEDVHLLFQQVNAKDMDQLRNMIDEFKQKYKTIIIVLATELNGKVQLAAGVSKELVDRGIHAGKLIKRVAEVCGGGGGGRPEMAQAGGNHPEKITEALEEGRKEIKQLLK